MLNYYPLGAATYGLLPWAVDVTQGGPAIYAGTFITVSSIGYAANQSIITTGFANQVLTVNSPPSSPSLGAWLYTYTPTIPPVPGNPGSLALAASGTIAQPGGIFSFVGAKALQPLGASYPPSFSFLYGNDTTNTFVMQAIDTPGTTIGSLTGYVGVSPAGISGNLLTADLLGGVSRSVLEDLSVGSTYYIGPDGRLSTLPVTGKVAGVALDPTTLLVQTTFVGSSTGARNFPTFIRAALSESRECQLRRLEVPDLGDELLAIPGTAWYRPCCVRSIHEHKRPPLRRDIWGH